MRNACTLTPSAYNARSRAATFLSSIVTSTRSMSDFAQTVSCDRLPHRMAARIERSALIRSTRASSAVVNVWWIEPDAMRRSRLPVGNRSPILHQMVGGAPTERLQREGGIVCAARAHDRAAEHRQ